MNVIKRCATYVVRYLRGTRAVAAMEYAIIVGVIVVAVGAAVMTFQDAIVDMITDVTADLEATSKEVTKTTIGKNEN